MVQEHNAEQDDWGKSPGDAEQNGPPTRHMTARRCTVCGAPIKSSRRLYCGSYPCKAAGNRKTQQARRKAQSKQALFRTAALEILELSYTPESYALAKKRLVGDETLFDQLNDLFFEHDGEDWYVPANAARSGPVVFRPEPMGDDLCAPLAPFFADMEPSPNRDVAGAEQHVDDVAPSSGPLQG